MINDKGIDTISIIIIIVSSSFLTVILLLSVFWIFSKYKLLTYLEKNNVLSLSMNKNIDQNDFLSKKYNPNWRELPKLRLIQLVKKFGEPCMITEKSNGSAVWLKDKLINTYFEEITIRDEDIENYDPINLKMCIDIKFKYNKKINKTIAEKFENVKYIDKKRKEIIISGNNINHILATLRIIIENSELFHPMEVEETYIDYIKNKTRHENYEEIVKFYKKENEINEENICKSLKEI